MNKPNRLAHISPADLHRVYDAFLRGLAAKTPDAHPPVASDHDYAEALRAYPRLASVETTLSPKFPAGATRASWSHMLAEVSPDGSMSHMLGEVSPDGSMSPVAYLRHDGTVHGLVRDYSVEHVNALSLLVGNGDILTGEIITTDHTGQARTHTRSIIAWTWGGRGVTTHDYITISAPLMTQVYRLTNTKTTRKRPKNP